LITKMSGMSCVYYEAGSGAERPVSNEMIQAVRNNVDIPIIVGGGIRDGDTAKEKIDAGADVIVTGTIIEKDRNSIEDIVKKIRD
ncbi:MAG: tryptophan synthase subunit alpha, partial [Methanomassiliicoccales archaeon]